MNYYEMIYILRPDIIDEQVNKEVDRYRDFLIEQKAQEVQIKIWGKRRLAYPINRFQDGIYVQMNYQADGSQIATLERDMRLSDEVIRYLTIKLKKPSKSAEAEEAEEADEAVAVEA